MVCVQHKGKGIEMAQSNVVTLFKINDEVSINSRNYARIAELLVTQKDGKGGRCLGFGKLTSTKLRGIYSLIMNVYTQINSLEDFEARMPDLQYIKVKMAYESGRDQEVVGDFIKKTYLMACIDDIASYEQFVLYCRYAESLVAYFKFYGGKE